MRTSLICGTMALALLGGCATQLSGLVQRTDGHVELLTAHGRTVRLVLDREDVRPVARLQDHMVDLEGRRSPRGLVVTDFKVHQGLHGMAAWVGVLEPLGVRLAIRDRTSGALYVLAADSAEALGSHVGQPVLLEGYVEGPHEVRVMYFRVLAESP